jgi:hypothetical protein
MPVGLPPTVRDHSDSRYNCEACCLWHGLSPHASRMLLPSIVNHYRGVPVSSNTRWRADVRGAVGRHARHPPHARAAQRLPRTRPNCVQRSNRSQRVCVQMREALMGVMRGIRRMHGLPDGYLTPDRNAKFKSKEEQAADKAALAAQLHAKLASAVKLPPVRPRRWHPAGGCRRVPAECVAWVHLLCLSGSAAVAQAPAPGCEHSSPLH